MWPGKIGDYMKRFTIAIAVMVMVMVSAYAQASVVINNSWTGGITSTGLDAKAREVYTIDDQAAVPMYKVVKGATKYMATPVEVVAGELHMGSCTHDIAQAHHAVSLEYAWNAALTNVGVQFYYGGRSNAFTYLTVNVGYRSDMNNTGFTDYVYEVLRTKEGGNHTVSPAAIKAIVGDKPFNVIYIQEHNIGISTEGVLDNIIISADNVPVTVPFVTVQKPGMYTAEITTGAASADVYVNGVITTTFYTDIAYIGVLDAGDEIRIVANGEEAESIQEIDWQSWNFIYANGSVQIYVEDPPISVCEPTVVEVEVIKEVQVPVEVIKTVEVPVEVIKTVEVVKEVPVEVIREVEVIKTVEVVKEVQVPIEVIKEVEVIKTVEVPVEVIKEVEIIKEVPVEIIKEVEVEVEIEVLYTDDDSISDLEAKIKTIQNHIKELKSSQKKNNKCKKNNGHHYGHGKNGKTNGHNSCSKR
jgi:hypothetical protein